MDQKKNTRKITAIEEATRIFYESINLTYLDKEVIQLENSLDRVLAVNLLSAQDLPNVDKSAVDGYAVSAKDTFSASPNNPILLRLRSQTSDSELTLKTGEGVYVHTGSPMTKGANAVVMIEFTEKINHETIEVYKPVAPRDDVSWKGEDVRKGESIYSEGTRLKPQDLGMLAALHIPTIEVYKKPLIGILSTGSELIPLESERKNGKIVDVNSIVLSALVCESGCMPLRLGCVKDDFQAIRLKIKEGLEKSNLLLVSGGTSEGQTDLTVKAIDSLGKPGVVVHGVAMRPGRPTALASIDGKPIINLSGYPVAAMMGFYVFGRPLLKKLLGTKDDPVPKIRARVTRRIPSGSGLRNFVRVVVSRIEDKYVADPVRATGSGIISSMVKANGLVIIPEEVEGIDENEEVDVVLFNPI